jgi:hypothetical protein
LIRQAASLWRVDWHAAGGRLARLLPLLCGLLFTGVALGQPAGTYPPPEVVRPPAGSEASGKIPLKGILLLDVSGNRVFMPGLSYERVYELESGATSQTRRYLFDSIKIDGKVEGSRAELTVEVRVEVEATGGETIEIPLEMENFHRLGPTEFFAGREGDNEFAVAVDEETGSYELIANVRKETVVGFRMQMSARVETEAAQSLDFRLPPSPTTVELLTDMQGVAGEIPNRDDEVIRTATDESGRSRFTVESSGGRFTLQWGKMDRPVTTPLLEATSVISMQWNSPQDQLIQSVRMTVRDSRAPISGFSLRLPDKAVLIDRPKLGSSGQFVRAEASPEDPQLYAISIPRSERRTSYVLEFRVEIPSDSPGAEKPLLFEVPVVEGALRNQGTFNISTGADYRLRWREQPYVKNNSSAEVDDASIDQRVYSFQFIRGAFELPVWLEATRRELRVRSRCDIEMRDNYANLTMEIESIGNGARAQKLSVDLGDWQAFSVENSNTGAPLFWYDSDGLIEIETNYTGMEESTQVLIKADRLIEIPESNRTRGHRLALPIPRVVGSGDRRDPVTVQQAEVHLTGRGRRVMVVDLEQSEHLERSVSDAAEPDDSVREFTVMPPESAATMAGTLVTQPPRLVLESSARVQLTQDRVKTVVDWTVESQVDLEGRLRIVIPSDRMPANGQRPDNDAGTAADQPGATDEWFVTVNGTPAELRPVAADSGGAAATVPPGEEPEAAASPDSASPADPSSVDGDEQLDAAARPNAGELVATPDPNHFDIISDRLSDGPIDIRFETARTLPRGEAARRTTTLASLPYPLVDDITLKGDVTVDLVGDDFRELAAEQQMQENPLVFRTLPQRPIPLRVFPRPPVKNELVADNVLVRSAISEVSQHDQLIASLAGSGEFELQLRQPDKLVVEVLLDGEAVPFRTVEQRLIVSVPNDGSARHVIDVRLWIDRSGSDVLETIEPLAVLGPGAGKFHWQVLVPKDNHLVWAASSLGRPMRWTVEQWRLLRQPLLNENTLVGRVIDSTRDRVELSPMPSGNRYLFTAMDDRTFRVRTASRTLLWLAVAGVIVLIATLVTYLPATRSPLSAVVAMVAFAGLLSVAPDAAVLVGQVAMLSLGLVVVMFAIRSLVLPAPSRVLTSTRDSRIESSSRSGRKAPEYRPPSSLAMTHSIGQQDITSAPDEVAP